MHDIARTLGDPTRPPEPRFAESTGRRGGGAALECQTLEAKCGKGSVEVSSLTSQGFVISVLGNPWGFRL